MAARKANRVDGRASFDEFWSLNEVNEYLLELEANYPELASVEQIGTSYEGRPIYAIKISRNNGQILDTNPIILADGTIHAR